ncbi:helix-turn-helix transcriptional regulator [Anaerolineales bacterium HSG25]|nr:helix-turn-helix transcriptional regulator [Anaerolineales bacterium HSG25]
MVKKIHNRVKELIAEKERRSGKRYPYRDIALSTGLSKNTVGKWVRNETQEYDRGVIAKFLEYFDCEISDLFVYEETDD